MVNGQKTWTTLAQHAGHDFCLVRTSSEGRKQEGISFLRIDMQSPGITVRPIIINNGEHEVFFDNVRVPARNRVGEEGRGWTYAKFLLGYERTNIANVGGEILDAVLDRLNPHSRIALCGVISRYASGERHGLKNTHLLLVNRVRLRRFLVFDDPALAARRTDRVLLDFYAVR